MRRFFLFSFLLLLWLLAGCQSSRPAFYFGSRPAAVATDSAAAPLMPTTKASPSPAVSLRPRGTIWPQPRRRYMPWPPARPTVVARWPVSPLLTRHRSAAAVGPFVKPQRVRHILAARACEARFPQRQGIDLGSFVLPLLIALLIFLIAKFPLVTLIVLGVIGGLLLLAGLAYVIMMTTGHWSFG